MTNAQVFRVSSYIPPRYSLRRRNLRIAASASQGLGELCEATGWLQQPLLATHLPDEVDHFDRIDPGCAAARELLRKYATGSIMDRADAMGPNHEKVLRRHKHDLAVSMHEFETRVRSIIGAMGVGLPEQLFDWLCRPPEAIVARGECAQIQVALPDTLWNRIASVCEEKGVDEARFMTRAVERVTLILVPAALAAINPEWQGSLKEVMSSLSKSMVLQSHIDPLDELDARLGVLRDNVNDMEDVQLFSEIGRLMRRLPPGLDDPPPMTMRGGKRQAARVRSWILQVKAAWEIRRARVHVLSSRDGTEGLMRLWEDRLWLTPEPHQFYQSLAVSDSEFAHWEHARQAAEALYGDLLAKEGRQF